MAFPLLEEQSCLAGKIETTAGTAESLTATEAAMNIFNATIEEEIPEIIRTGQGTGLDSLASVPGARMGRAKFSHHLVGNGSSGIPLWASTFLPACGMVAASQVYGWASGGTAQKTVTIGLYEDGVLRSISGAMGTFSILFKSGEPAVVEFEFMGKLEVEADATMLIPTYPTTIPPRFAGATVTIGSFTPAVASLSINANNALFLREDPSHVTAYSTAIIGSRRPTMAMDPEATLVATANFMTKLTSSTEEAFVLDLGSVSNNIVNIDGPKCQLIKKARSIRNKYRVNSLDFGFNRSTGIDDSLTLGFA